MTPPPDERIRSSLAFLRNADRRIIKSLRQLQKLFGENDPPGVSELLKRHVFHVDGHRYAGRMTQTQADFLAPFESKTLEEFANALATLLLCLDGTALSALNSLETALNACQQVDPSADTAKRSKVFIGVTLGCCTYDTQPPREGVSRATCDGLVGDWVRGLCPPDATGGKPGSKSAAQGKSSGS
ncbi:hypothetical protein BH10PLA2_BH10PLA2_30650 [soil metagenome]